MKGKNIDQEVLSGLRCDGELLYDFSDAADKWVEKNLKHEQKIRVGAKMKDTRRIVRKVIKSINNKPVFALFGASQVGKSYLVKNLLSINGKPLEIILGNKKYDFLKDINPPGTGAESTGVVTRFSVENSNYPEGFPIMIKLLDVKDLIIILSDSYFSDINKLENYPSIDKFNEMAERIESFARPSQIKQEYFTEDDVWEIKNYFHSNFNLFHYYVNNIEESNFWFTLGKYASKIEYIDLINFLSILWNNNEYLSEVFRTLINALNRIDFMTTVYAMEDAVLRSGHAILDVQRLKEIFSSDKPIDIVNNSSIKYSIPSSILSALSSELTLSVGQEISDEKAFLQQTDLLDFPGARSRLDLAVDTINRDSVPDMLLRGKIAYLFNKYSSDYEINNLLFCTNDKQLDVNEIPTLLNDWICNNVGVNSADREQKLQGLSASPLFVIFTFYNRQLTYDSTNDDKDLTYKWNNRFTRFFENEIVSANYNWHKSWTSSNPLFKNFYLLRDFKFSGDIFEGFEENGIEKNVHESRIDYLKKLEESFLNYPFVIEHINNPKDLWNSASNPNSDGSDFIITNLEPAANNITKTKNYVGILEDNKEQLVSSLSKYFHSNDISEKRRIAFRKGSDLQLNLNRVFGKSPDLFSAFLNQLSLKESDVYQLIHLNLLETRVVDSYDEYTFFKSQFPRLSSENTFEENLEILKEDLQMLSNEEVTYYLKEHGYDLTKAFENKFNTSATALVEKILNLWKEKFNHEKLQVYFDNGLTKSVFDIYFDALFETFQNLEVQQLLVKLVEQKTKRLQLGRDAEEYLASVSTHIINDFVTNFGFNYFDNNRLIEIKTVCDEMKVDVSFLFDSEMDDDLPELESLFVPLESGKAEFNPVVENFNKYVLKIKLALISNCGNASFNIEENNKLGEIISKCEKLEFKID